MTELEKKIAEASQKYYTSGDSPLTDEEFDALVSQLRQEQPDSELLQDTGTGYDLSNTPGEKYKHKYGVAGSLTKAYTYKEIDEEFKHSLMQLSLKLDGISVVLYYEKGVLVQALTRGDGTTGIDITEKIKIILPGEIKDEGFTGAVRGEILMDRDNWEVFHAQNPESKNPRNSTAGLINQNGISPFLKRLKVVVYTVVGEEIDPNIGTHFFGCLEDIMDWLEVNFEDVVPYEICALLHPDNIDDFEGVRDGLNEGGRLPVDGLVMKLDDIVHNGNEIVYKAQAFKFDAESAVTDVEDVEWVPSKTRYMIPRIKVRTVNISGTNVSYCTGYNAAYIRDNNIGWGTVLRVSKHGEIIPNVDEVITPTSAGLPTKCPVCGHELSWSGVHLMCTNAMCGNAVEQDTLIWVKALAPMDGFKDQLILKYLDIMKQSKLIHSIMIEDIMIGKCIPISEGSKQGRDADWVNLWNTLQSGSIKPYDALMALNIPRLGDITCGKLMQHPKLIRDLVCKYGLAGYELASVSIAYELTDVVGTANAQSIINNIDKFRRLEFILDRIDWKSSKEYAAPSNGVKVAITGKLSVKRSDFEKELKSCGFIPGEMSKDTKYLITDDPTSSSSKNVKATQLGIEKITEAEFRAKFMSK